MRDQHITCLATNNNFQIDLVNNKQIDVCSFTSIISAAGTSRGLLGERSRKRSSPIQSNQLPPPCQPTSSCPELFQTPKATMELRTGRLRSMTVTILVLKRPESPKRKRSGPPRYRDTTIEGQGYQECTAAPRCQEILFSPPNLHNSKKAILGSVTGTQVSCSCHQHSSSKFAGAPQTMHNDMGEACR
jgi:hypothetical protein